MSTVNWLRFKIYFFITSVLPFVLALVFVDDLRFFLCSKKDLMVWSCCEVLCTKKRWLVISRVLCRCFCWF